jgi:hypothetical protein
MRATRDYLLRMPPDTTVVAACHEVRCEAWQFGWDTIVDERTPLGAAQAAYIRHQSGRTFREMGSPDGVTVFRFESRQRCFAEHRTKPARWLVRGYGLREHSSMRGWIDDLAEHVGQLEDQIRRG